MLFEHRVPDGTRNRLRFAADGSILLQRDVTKDDDSQAKTSLRIAGDSGDLEIKLGDSMVVTLKHGSKIEITAKDMPIDVTCRTFTVNGDLVVSKGAVKTTISGNSIKGG